MKDAPVFHTKTPLSPASSWRLNLTYERSNYTFKYGPYHPPQRGIPLIYSLGIGGGSLAVVLLILVTVVVRRARLGPQQSRNHLQTHVNEAPEPPPHYTTISTHTMLDSEACPPPYTRSDHLLPTYQEAMKGSQLYP